MRPRPRLVSIRRFATAASVAAVVTLLSVAASDQKIKPRPRPDFGKCEAEAEKLVGEKPLRIKDAAKFHAPNRLQGAPLKFPPDTKDRIGSGIWVGEALIEADGRIRHVWVLREVKWTPPWPEFNQAIVDTVKQWVYAPTLVEGHPVPVCLTMTVNINWR